MRDGCFEHALGGIRWNRRQLKVGEHLGEDVGGGTVVDCRGVGLFGQFLA
jgi:hypothetical protein